MRRDVLVHAEEVLGIVSRLDLMQPVTVRTKGKLVIDLPQRRARWDGVEVRLTAGELAIVVLLVSHAGSCVDNRTVYDSLHYKGFQSGQGDKGFWVDVRSAIRRIRNKFRAIDSSFGELENVRAFGYRWRKSV